MRCFSVPLGLALTLCAGPSAAERGLLWGQPPPVPREPATLDPNLPTGPETGVRIERPASTEPPACSFRRPVCVHRGQGVSGETALTWLAALERAYESAVLATGAPAPLPDPEGGPPLDLYLKPGVEELRVEHSTDFWVGDRVTAFCVAGTDSTVPLRAATLCVGEAIAFRLDAAEGAHFRRALAEHLWLLVGEPTSDDARAVDDFQSRPELSPLRREVGFVSEGSTVLLDYLDHVHGVAGPGAVPLSIAALAAAADRGADALAPAFRFLNEPDVADVLRSTFGAGNPTAYARFWSDFAVARAFVGSRSDGRLPMLDWTGAFGRVRFDWSVKLSSFPRHLASPRPLEPLGSAYIYVDLDKPLDGASIAFRAQWEPPVAFKWTLVTVTADGRELSRIDVPYQERAREVERTLVNLAGARGVIVVGTNLGDLSPTFPFDPDYEPWERHGWGVYLVEV